jgi:short-subunit dehydrogenase
MAENRPYAMVTGASSGIGLELARQFADAGFDLIIAAEEDAINAAAAELSAAGVEVEAVQADLASYEGVEQLWARASRPVDAVCLNAGIGVGGRFAETDLKKELHLIDLNVAGTVHLAKKAVVDMVGRGSGRLLFTSSIASTQPGPYEAVYAASKSFVESFSEALRQEVAGNGVTVTALLPGPTDTPFFDKAELTDTKLGQSSKDDPALVARQGFQALMAGEEKVFAGGLKSKAMGRAGTVLPDSVMAKTHAKMSEPGSA